MKFVVHLKGVGEGCDYTIGCNQKTIELPSTIKTLNEAYKYVVGDIDSWTEENNGVLSDYGIDCISSAKIYCIVDEININIDELIQKKKAAAALEQQRLQRKIDEAEFERLARKLGKN